MTPRFRLLLGLPLLALACGGGQTRGHPFERAWHDDSGSELAGFIAQWRMPERREVGALVVGSIEGRELVGGAFGAEPWRVAFSVEGQPLIAGAVVVAIGGGRLVALDAASGRRLWTLPALGRLRGASDDGVTTLVSLDSLSGRRSIVLAVARNGTVMRQIVEEERIGAPVVLDEMAFLPLGGRAVIVFDLVEGAEAARVVATVPLSRAYLADDGLYVGDDELVRFDADIVGARWGRGRRVHPPRRLLPGNPRWLTTPEGGDRPRSFLLGQPTRAGRVAAAYVAGPFVIGLRPSDGATDWVVLRSSVVLAGRAASGGFVLCHADGVVAALDDRGAEVARASLGTPVDRCDAAVGPLPAAPHAPPPLVEGLVRALASPIPDRLDVQLLLIDDLARLDDSLAKERLDALANGADLASDSPDEARARSTLREHARVRLRASAPPPIR